MRSPGIVMMRAASALGLWLAASCGAEKTVDPTVIPPTDNGRDLTIRFISRLPRLDYVWNSANPRVEGWPTAGQTVTWQAEVINWANVARDVPYRWLLDGEEAFRSSVSIEPGATVAVGYEWPWTFERHQLTFEVDPDDTIDEEEERNNRLTVFTDALSVGFYIERSLYDLFRQHQREVIGAASTSFEDWAQRHIAAMNDIFNAAVYPETPDGVLDRVRLDKIEVVNDGALVSAQAPDPDDRTVDLMWGFPASVSFIYYGDNGISVGPKPPFEFNWSLLHELGHARYLVDVYAFRIYHGYLADRVDIMEGDELAVTTGLMPATKGPMLINGISFPEVYTLFQTPEQGLMNQDYTFVDRYSAVALNRIAGHRATQGNYNAPANIGVFMNDFPERNRLTVRDENGTALAGASVRVYQGYHQPGFSVAFADTPHRHPYMKYFDNTPDLDLTADAQGRVELGRNPFDTEDRIDGFLTTSMIIVRVEQGGRVGYGYLERRPFNFAKWAGASDLADYELQVTPKTPE